MTEIDTRPKPYAVNKSELADLLGIHRTQIGKKLTDDTKAKMGWVHGIKQLFTPAQLVPVAEQWHDTNDVTILFS